MSVLYVETSAVLGWLFGEPSAGRTRAALDAADEVVTSVLTLLEAERALIRFQTQGQAREADIKRALGHLKRLAAGWVTMEISQPILARAANRFPVEPVRALDAIHLATALELNTGYPELEVLSFDQRVLINLSPLGLGAASP